MQELIERKKPNKNVTYVCELNDAKVAEISKTIMSCIFVDD